MLDGPSLIPRLGAIKVPTLFICGTEDPLFPVAVARKQAGAIPDVRFEVVPGTAHQSLWESPEHVLPRLRAFISALDGGPALRHTRSRSEETSSAAGTSLRRQTIEPVRSKT